MIAYVERHMWSECSESRIVLAKGKENTACGSHRGVFFLSFFEARPRFRTFCPSLLCRVQHRLANAFLSTLTDGYPILTGSCVVLSFIIMKLFTNQ